MEGGSTPDQHFSIHSSSLWIQWKNWYLVQWEKNQIAARKFNTLRYSKTSLLPLVHMKTGKFIWGNKAGQCQETSLSLAVNCSTQKKCLCFKLMQKTFSCSFCFNSEIWDLIVQKITKVGLQRSCKVGTVFWRNKCVFINTSEIRTDIHHWVYIKVGYNDKYLLFSLCYKLQLKFNMPLHCRQVSEVTSRVLQ